VKTTFESINFKEFSVSCDKNDEKDTRHRNLKSSLKVLIYEGLQTDRVPLLEFQYQPTLLNIRYLYAITFRLSATSLSTKNAVKLKKKGKILKNTHDNIL
jgi:hypothetical protein